MAGKKQFPNGTWQYTFKRKGVLDKPLYQTFATEAEGDAFAARVEVLLDRGIVPGELREKAQHPRESGTGRLTGLILRYLREGTPSQKDRENLNVVFNAKGDTLIQRINAHWVDEWIAEMKRVDRAKPTTVRAKIGACARMFDWAIRKEIVTMPDRPFRNLAVGYSQYSEQDVKMAGVEQRDEERDRRLEPGEFERILAVIDAGVIPRKFRDRDIEFPAAARCIFVLAQESAMRLREMYTLTLDQVDLARRTVFLEKTKNGSKRQVPISRPAQAAIEAYLAVREIPPGRPANLLFPWWGGDESVAALRATTDFLSKFYIAIFRQAGCEDLFFHDLRHEATCRLFERTNLSDLEIMKVTGHKSIKMLMRYANLRGSDLAERLW